VSPDRLARAPISANQIDDNRPAEWSFAAISLLLLLQTGALAIQVLAISMARRDAHAYTPAEVVSCVGYALAFASALWFLTRPMLTRVVRNAAVMCIGVTSTLQWRLTDPLFFTQFDEQLHMRTLRDINSSHGLFQQNPLLAVSPRYPGLEAVAVLFQQVGLPTMVAATAVVLVARLVLVLALCDVAENLTGSARAGGLAVAVYSVSPQFILFNTQFAYQTLALPLAVAAVAFVVRARSASDPRLLLGGATVCLLAVALTHHVTSLLTAGFLIVWTIAQRDRQARRRVLFAAVVAAVATITWAMIQRSLLREYFGPIVDDVRSQLTGGSHRAPFTVSGGIPTPAWERLFLIYHAGLVTFVAAWLVLIWGRAFLRRKRPPAPGSPLQQWHPPLLLVAIVAMIPTLFVARALPMGAEIDDRASSFLYLPLSVLVADAAVRWSRRPARHLRPRPARQALVQLLAVMLAAGVFVGGYLLGSGPGWARLSGNALASTDSRTTEVETLAAVRWADGGIPPGSRIGADRVTAFLLASESGLWPVMHENGYNVPSLYLDDEWGPSQTEVTRQLHLRYLYVDQRLADKPPYGGSYFYTGEMGDEPTPQFTRHELTKFNNVPGIQAVYRHGPIAIYDLGGLGVPEMRTGWHGEARSASLPVQLAIGLLLGLILALVGRSRAGSIGVTFVRSFTTTAGPALTFAAAVAALCVTSTAMLLAHIWLGPTVFLSMGLAVLVVNPHWTTHMMRTLWNRSVRLSWRWIAAAIIVSLPVATLIAQSALDASVPDVKTVRAILDDPAAVHVPARCAWPATGSCDEAR
jgi:hypothetical protein